LPLIERLDGLRAPRTWGEWLDGLRPLAEAALDNPDGVLDLLDDDGAKPVCRNLVHPTSRL
jgi:hypothetical protein